MAITWLLDEAYGRALWHRSAGRRVIAGGPGVFLAQSKKRLEEVAEIGTTYPDAIARHNPAATIASRGCPVGCWFCIVPAMEGREFTLLPDFPVRPILCDNNLSALPEDYQRFIIERYLAEDVPLLDANSGFEPRTFDRGTFLRWSKILRGPWRFAFDDMQEWHDVERTARILRREGVAPRKMRVYVLIGNEPFDVCMERINRVIAMGGEPHVQPYIKLNALEKRPYVRFDWTEQLLRDVARWSNRFLWKFCTFEEYGRSRKTSSEPERYDEQTGLFQ
ncbi:MAG TPA: hypothetical protein VEL28_13075 [Candidatus Binatia bacterium]|nr:hypothetical protein [Candidatus Binatia bacterium]